jgi:excisionase family DNA binding protein
MRQGTMQTNIESNRNTMVTERKTISIMKACELVGVSRRTIYNWIAGGKVEYVRTAGGSVRIFVDTLWREPARGADLSRKEAS